MKTIISHKQFFRFILFSLLALISVQAQTPTISAADQAVLDRISADSLRGHLSFIASDLLEGRNTPSRGLDIAAEYIAAQFRRAGLEPVGDDGYFQTANWVQTVPNLEGFTLTIRSGKRRIKLLPHQISYPSDQALSVPSARLYKVDFNDPQALAAIKPELIAGKILITEIPDFRRVDRSQRGQIFRAQTQFLNAARALKPALIISVDRYNQNGTGASSQRLIDPERRPTANQMSPVLTLHAPQVVKLFDAMKPGASFASVGLSIAAATEQPVKLRNVVGVLRGSDPELKDSYVLVTAHYDHVGKRDGVEGDQIFNGANDDASGTVSVIELASALVARKERPKRSIVFMTVFGEEKGLLGSRYYGRHPIFPIEKTVANINLEQVGRTDSSEGSEVNRASLTGFDFSDIGTIFQAAGQLTGINVYKHPTNSDSFFGRSDNQALADQGVPAHTLCVAYEYPDYHGAGDHWDKIDYDNMARTNRMIALGLLMIADNPIEPKWNEANPKAARYFKAWQERHLPKQ